MNKINNTYRFVAITLSVLILSTSVSFAVDMHYCKDRIKSYSFFGKAKNCYDMAEALPARARQYHNKMMGQNESCSLEKTDCCKNKTLHFQSDQNQQIQTSDLVVSNQLLQFVSAYVAVFFTNDFSIECDAASFTNYEPPLILRDIPVLFESFLL